MGLFSLFHYSDSQLQRYKELEEEIDIIKAQAEQEFVQFSEFEQNCKARLRVISAQLEKGKSEELSSSKTFINNKYKNTWTSYLQTISDLRLSLQKAKDEQVDLLKTKSVRSYVSFKSEDDTAIKKAVKSLVLGYSANQINREDFSKGFSKVLSLDVENPGIIEFLGSELEKAEKKALFQDFIDVIKEVISNHKAKSKYADGIIFNDKGEILFLRRQPESEFAPYEYGLPGGHIDLGENPQDAVKREIKEECGLDVESCELKKRYEDDKAIIFYFQCKIKEPYEVVLTRDEHFNYEWLSHEARQEKSLIFNLNKNLDDIYGLQNKEEIEKGIEAQEEAMKHKDQLGEGAKKRKKLSPKDKFDVVMKEFSQGTLHSGDGSIVTDKDQALAIAYSESGLEKALDKGFTEAEIAKKYDITEDEAKKLLDEGEKVEKEHTKDSGVARTIASHHIYKESKDYYPELKKLEDKFKRDGIEKAMSDICLSVDNGEEDQMLIEKAQKVLSKLTKHMTVNKKGFLQTVYRSHPQQSNKSNPDRLKVSEKISVGGSDMDVNSFVKKFDHRISYTIRQDPETKKMYTHREGVDKKEGIIKEIQLHPFTLSHEFDDDSMEHLRSYSNGKEISKEEGVNHEKELKQMGFQLIREREQSEE